MPADRKFPGGRYDAWVWVRTASPETLAPFFADAGDVLNLADGNGRTALHEAAEYGSAATVEWLLRQGAAPDPRQDDGTTPLYRAGLRGNLASFDALLRFPVDVNNRNCNNLWTILMVATAEGHEEIVKRLLDRADVDVNARADRLGTALHIAAARGYLTGVKLLLERADIRINQKNLDGWTPLIRAAFTGDADIVRLLCARQDLAPNAVDQDRQTALHWAVMAGHIEVVSALLERPDINPSLTSRPEMRTAHDLAVAMHYDAMAALLEEKTRSANRPDELDPGDVYLPRPPAEPPTLPLTPTIWDPDR